LETAQAAGQLDQAVQLYRGEFLEGFYVRDCAGFEGWQVRERERFHHLAVNALHELAAYFLECGDYPAGIARATRLLALIPDGVRPPAADAIAGPEWEAVPGAKAV
jgi:DNA-binding SARP family transcriptional activator